MVDYQGSLWVVSSSQGISKVLNNIFEDMFFKLHIDSTKINSVVKYQGCLYAGTDSHVYCINVETGELVEDSIVSTTLDKTRVRDLLVANDKLYIGCYGNKNYSLVIFDGENINHITANQLAFDNSDIVDMCNGIRSLATYQDKIYVGTNYGISLIQGNTVIKTIQTGGRVLNVNITGDKAYVCSEAAGLQIYDLDLNKIKQVEGTEDMTPLKSFVVDDMIFFSANSILYYNENNETKKSNFKCSGTVCEINVIDDKLWVGTDCGLYLVPLADIKKETVDYTLYYKGEGLKEGLVANSKSYYDEENRIYYLSTLSGVFKISVDNMRVNDVNPIVSIGKVIVDNKEYSQYNLPNLPKNTERITIDLEVLSYLKDDRIKVYYKLDGFNKEFSEFNYKDNSSISFTNLKGGEYNFILYCVDGQGNHSANTINLHFYKEVKLIEQGWYHLLLFVAGLLLIVLIGWTYGYFKTKEAVARQLEYKEITVESIEAIARTIDAKDSYTNGHSLRVGWYSRKIAEKMGIKDNQLENIYYVALLHDIGKIGIPDAILNKPGKLTDEEYKVMKSHPVIGTKILSSIKTIPGLLDGAEYHHERYDGKGYPFGLSGENIPLYGRIICCADSYDAMNSKRVYREKINSQEIIEEFKRCSGYQFDPKIVKVVIELIENGELEYPEENKKS